MSGQAPSYSHCPLCRDRCWPRYEAIASELEIGHDRKAHLIYELLAKASLNFRAVAEMTDAELRRVPGIGPEYLKRIREKVPVPGEEQLTAEDPQVLLGAARMVLAQSDDPATHALRRAVAAALREAAEDYGRCARINARRPPGTLTELPNPVSEALMAAARLYVGAT